VSPGSASTVKKFHTNVQIATFSFIVLFEILISVGILFEEASVAIVNSLK